MISARIVADSVNPCGDRITSFELKYPRFIHSELMTHRMLSRNAASSRAIPLKKMIDSVLNETAMPVYWGREQKGMQSGDELEPAEKELAILEWNAACHSACTFARRMGQLGVHKSIANRLIEPFAHMVTLVTATDWVNFFNLRAHPEAQKEFQVLAYEMFRVWTESKPVPKRPNEWHLPYADQFAEGLSLDNLKKISTARAARTSVKNQNGEIKHEDDYALHDRLLNNKHWSPFEHPAQALASSNRVGNFKGWIQYRKFFQNENMTVLTVIPK